MSSSTKQDLTNTSEDVTRQRTSAHSSNFITSQDTIMNQEKKPTFALVKTQAYNFFMMALSYIVILLTALVRGGEGKPSIFGIKECTSLSWLTLGVSQFICLGFAFVNYKYNENELDDQDRLAGLTDTPANMSNPNDSISAFSRLQSWK